MLSRRAFIAGSTVTALGLGFVPALATAGRHKQLGRADFEALRHTPFRVFDGEGQGFGCTLEEVRDGPIAPGLDQFTLVFERSDGGKLTRGVYELWHRKLRSFHLNLDSSGRERTSRFVAVFGQRTRHFAG